MPRRRVLFITAGRADYDLLAPVALAAARSAALAPQMLPMAAQLSPFHGSSLAEIASDGLPIASRLESLLSSESWGGRALSFAHGVEGLARTLAHDPPELLFVAGDREEALAGALAGTFLRIPVAHAFGGDRCIASDVDEVFRPAISKLAHLHFAATHSHRERLLRMGERADTVWTCGATGLDRLRATPDLDDDVLARTIGFDARTPFFLLIQHPSPCISPESAGEEMRIVLDALLSLGHHVVCSYPNYDPGNVAMRHAIDAASRESRLLITYRNLPRDVFVALYRRADAIVGNSSSIVIESAFLKVPGILVGPRQDLRELSSNVLRVDIDRTAIAAAARRALEDGAFRDQVSRCESIYGDGHASERIVAILSEVELDKSLLLKTMSY